MTDKSKPDMATEPHPVLDPEERASIKDAYNEMLLCGREFPKDVADLLEEAIAEIASLKDDVDFWRLRADNMEELRGEEKEARRDAEKRIRGLREEIEDLEFALRYLGAMTYSSVEPDYETFLDMGAIKRARAAIAKAKGEV